MSRVLLSICLLAFSGYIWPSLYKSSSSRWSFIAFVAVGFIAVACLCWLSLKIDSPASPRLSAKQLAWLTVWSIPVVALEIALAIAYWAYIGGAQLDLGAMGAISGVLLIGWTMADAGIRGLSEEAVFRGLLQPALMTRYESHAGGNSIAILITTFWFLVAHLYGISDYRLLPHLALLSVWYGYLVARTGSFISSAILHVMHNAAAILVAYIGLELVGFEYARRMFEGSIARGIFCLVLLAVANFAAIDLLARRWAKSNLIARSERAP